MSLINPKIHTTIVGAPVPVGIAGRRVLLIGQKTPAGTAPSGVLVQNIDNLNSQDTLFGADSILAAMVRGFKEINKVTQVDAIPQSDAGTAVQAAGAIVFTGTSATEAGRYTITCGSRENNTYLIDVAVGDTPTIIGGKLETAINADNYAPVTAVNTTGSVATTAVNGGLEGNFISLQVLGAVAGITVAITAMTGGANNPSDPDLSQLVNIRYTDVVIPESYNLDYFVNWMEARFNTGTYRILDGIVITCITDSYADFISFSNAENKKTAELLVNKEIDTSTLKGSAVVELDYVIGAKFAAIDSLRLSQDADISSLVIASNSPKDYLGGIHVSTLPFHNTPIQGLYPIDPKNEWTDTEVDALTDAGFTVIGNNSAENGIILNTAVTRYLTDGAGDPDLSFKYLNYIEQSSVVREYINNGLLAAYKQSRLTTGIKIQGYSMANASDISATCISLYDDLAQMAVVPAGDDAEVLFSDNLNVTIDSETGTAYITMLDPVMTQLRNAIVTIQMTFNPSNQ